MSNDDFIDLTDEQYNLAAIHIANDLGQDPEFAPLGKYASEVRHTVRILKSIAKVVNHGNESTADGDADSTSH